MNALHDNIDLDKCLCCGQPVLERGNPITPERAARAQAILTAVGLAATIFSASTGRSSTISRRA